MTSKEIAALTVVAVIAFWMLGAYNRLVRLRQGVVAAYQQVDAQFRERHDLLAELVEALTAPLQTDAPEAVAAVDAARLQARIAADHALQRAASAGRLASLALAEQVLRTALTRLVTLVKASAALRSDPRLRTVLANLSATQHRLSAARQAFNVAVAGYNGSARQFPTRLVAGLFGFRTAGEL